MASIRQHIDKYRNRATLIPAVMLVIITILLFAPVVRHMVDGGSDYSTRVVDVESLLATGEFARQRPHPLYQGLILAVGIALPGREFDDASVIVASGVYVATALIIYFWLKTVIDAGLPALRAGWVSLMLTLALLLFAPITFLWLHRQNLYFGYIVANAYHNPTTTLVKPLALLQFLVALQTITTRDRPPTWLVAAAFIISLGSALAKPSYIIALLPALGLVFGLRWLLRLPVNWWLMLFGIVIPTGLVLSYQYFFFTSEMGGFIWQPFGTLGIYSDNLPLKFLLSITFPLVVIVLFPRQALRNIALWFSWLIFGVGAFYTYFLAETNDLTAGNFWWSGQITLFIVFVVSVVFVLRQLFNTEPSRSKTLRIYASGLVFALHIACGLLWYYVHASRLVEFTAELVAGQGWW